MKPSYSVNRLYSIKNDRWMNADGHTRILNERIGAY